MKYEHGDFFGAYPDGAYHGNRRFLRYTDPEIRELTDRPVTLRLGYHPSQRKPDASHRASVIEYFYQVNGSPLSGGDVLLVIGGAFNWLGEALEDLVPGLEAWCIDPSPWVHHWKDKSPDANLRDQIAQAGYEGQPVGDYLFNLFKDAAPYSRSPLRVVPDLGALPAYLEVTRIVSEDCWQVLKDEEKLPYKDYAEARGVEILHYIEGGWY